jgi:hypothetical protein
MARAQRAGGLHIGVFAIRRAPVSMASFETRWPRSSVIFQGNGESAVPAAPPMTKDKKHLLDSFIDLPRPVSLIAGGNGFIGVHHSHPGPAARVICGTQSRRRVGFARSNHEFRHIAHGTWRSRSFSCDPSCCFQAGDLAPPDIPAVPGDAVFFIRVSGFRMCRWSVAGHAIHLGAVNMGRMGKKDTVRLPGVDQPGHFASLGHVLFEKGFVLGRPSIWSWQSMHWASGGRRKRCRPRGKSGSSGSSGPPIPNASGG